MMILVDTSVWIEHLRLGSAELSQLLQAGQIVMHPMVLGELACGNLQHRSQLLALWEQLPCSEVATDHEVLRTIEQNGWMGKGIGFVDAHLLAGALLTPNTRLWAQDKRLQKLAEHHGVAYAPML